MCLNAGMSDHEPAASLPALSIDDSGTVSDLIVAIDEAVEAQRDLEQQLRCDFGVNNTDFRALLLIFRLRRRGLPARPGDLSRGLGISSGAATQVAGRLTGAGLLQRSPDPHDGRTDQLDLSPDAAARLAAATRAVRGDLDRIIATLRPDEEQRIIGLLHEVRDAFHTHRSADTEQPA